MVPRRSAGLSLGKIDEEAGSRTHLAAHRYGGAEALGEMPNDGKPQACSAELPASGLVDAIERSKSRGRCRQDARPVARTSTRAPPTSCSETTTSTRPSGCTSPRCRRFEGCAAGVAIGEDRHVGLPVDGEADVFAAERSVKFATTAPARFAGDQGRPHRLGARLGRESARRSRSAPPSDPNGRDLPRNAGGVGSSSRRLEGLDEPADRCDGVRTRGTRWREIPTNVSRARPCHVVEVRMLPASAWRRGAARR